MGERTDEELEANRDEVRRQLEATAFPDRVEAVARLLARERLELLGLQEVCEWHVEGALMWDFAALLVEALEAAGEPYDVVVTDPPFSGSGTLRLGGSVVHVRLTGSNVVLRRRGSPVEVLATDSGRFRRAMSVTALGEAGLEVARGWCSARCRLPGGGELAFVTTHTEAHDRASRDLQGAELLTVLPPG